MRIINRFAIAYFIVLLISIMQNIKSFVFSKIKYKNTKKLKKVISVVKLSLFPIWCWPLPRDATKFKTLCVKLHHSLTIIIVIGLVAPLIYAVTNHLDDPAILITLILMISAAFHAIFNFIFHMVNYHHIQNVTFELVHFSGMMKPHEKVLIQQYLGRCVPFHGASIFIFYFIAFLTVTMPAVTEQTFPTLAEYPFDVSYQPLKTIIFIHQSIAGVLISGQLCTNIFMALLMWFASARFEILSKELEKITNAHQLFKCIRKHQELLEYATEIALIARPFAFTSICCSTISLIATFLLFVTKQPIVTILQFFGLALACISEIFMYTWPAEHLMFTCYNVAQAAFNVLENNHVINLIETWKYLQIIIMRSQKPVTISIPCFLPTLSLNYFKSYLSVTYSYFTTLRVMMSDDNN